MKRLSIALLLALALASFELVVPGVARAVYFLDYGDSIAISVRDHSEYNYAGPIRPDGEIQIPYLGDVDVIGQTPEQVAERVQAVLASTLRRPQVTVLVTGFRARTIIMLGQVARPGPLAMTNPRMTLYEAIASAGGFTPRAVQDKVYLIRGEGKLAKRSEINVDEMMRTGDFSHDVEVRPGDRVQVNEVWYPDLFAISNNLSLFLAFISSIGILFALYEQASRPRTP